MGYSILVKNTRGISVVAIFVKNVWGIKQARSRFPRHSLPLVKYQHVLIICYNLILSD